MSGVTLDRTRPTLCFVWSVETITDTAAIDSIDDRSWRRIDLLQIRGKGLSGVELETIAGERLRRLDGLPTRVIVNDRLDVALGVGAHGVHLGQHDVSIAVARDLAPASFLIGASTHDRDEIETAEREGADYAGLGAFAVTETKTDTRPLDLAAAREWSVSTSLPVLAIGGVDADSVRAALEIPAVTGIAVSAALQRARDPGRAIDELADALDAAWRGREATNTARGGVR